MVVSRFSVHFCVYPIILFTSFFVSAADIIKGDSDTKLSSFVNPIKVCSVGHYSRFYVGASQPGAKEFALAGMLPESNYFFPAAPVNVNLNEVENQQNPLYNSAIDTMAMLYGVEPNGAIDVKIDRLVVTCQKAPSTVYVVTTDTDPSKIRMLSNDSVKDASGIQPTSRIVQLTANNGTIIFAAVNDQQEQVFGNGNSGIAILAPVTIQSKKGDETSVATQLIQIDADPALSTENGARAAILNNSSDCLKIGKDARIEIVNNNIDMYWSSGPDVLYLGLAVQARNNEEQSGARALIAGHYYYGKLLLKPIAPDSAFDGKNNIIGGRGSDIAITIHQVRSILTTTDCNYVVVLGGYDSCGNSHRMVYALPVVINQSDPLVHGMLAKKGSGLQDIYDKDVPDQIVLRRFISPAQQPGDLYTADDIEVQVGHGPLQEGDISQIFPLNDAVYAVVTNPDDGYKGGIFHSQAIFDELGRIKEWTKWSRVGGNFYDYIHYAHIDQQTGNTIMVCGQTPSAINMVKRTKWGGGDKQGLEQLVAWLNSNFNQENAGIGGLAEFTHNTPGLKNINVLVAMGNNRVALAQLTTNNNCPLGGSDVARAPVEYSDGVIDKKVPHDSTAVLISGGSLNACGSLCASTITADGARGFLFVGGSKGLAVLLGDHDCSWLIAEGLTDNFSGLLPGTAFRTIGSYKFVRALIADDERAVLYVICDDRVDRINICQSNFKENCIDVQTIAQRGVAPFGSYETFFDGAFSKNSVVLGTSSGLYCTETTVDVRTVTHAQDVSWIKVHLPEGLSTVKYMQFVSSTGRRQDYARSRGGNIYVLDTHNGKNRAMVHRCAIDVQDTTAATMSILPDHFLSGTPSYYVEFDGCRDWIYNDGMLFFHAKKRSGLEMPLIELLSVRVRIGHRSGGSNNCPVPVDLDQTNNVRPMIRLSSSGALLLAKDDKLVVNE